MMMEWLPWAVFALVVTGMLALDLGVLHRRAHVVGFREAVTWSVVWVVISLAFAGLVWYWRGGETAMAYLAAYVVEKALSVDNLFVFLVLFAYFRVPKEQEHTVLFWGVLGALVMRALLIAGGLSLMHAFHAVTYFFGALLVLTGLRFAFFHGPGIEPETSPWLKRLRDSGSRWGPLVPVLIAVETTDLLFAIDSIPAVLAISTDPFVVYTSNVFAILGLRAMYFALSGFMERLRYFSLGLSAVLVFIGVKMLLADVYPIPIPFSLAVIVGLVGMAVTASLIDQRRLDASVRGDDDEAVPDRVKGSGGKVERRRPSGVGDRSRGPRA